MNQYLNASNDFAAKEHSGIYSANNSFVLSSNVAYNENRHPHSLGKAPALSIEQSSGSLER